MTDPTISVILPRRADDSCEQTIQAVRRADYPPERLEIIEALGESPSKQRNAAAQAASGEILYFLDNDSIVTPTLFSRVAKYYRGAQQAAGLSAEAPELAGVGGPNVTPPTDNFLQKTFGYALASPFAHFTMCARYKPTGKMRYAGEKELILCNLSIRRAIFLREGGFNEAMYPNEENEFINRLVVKGYKFLYDPDALLYRSRRNRFWGFIRQLFNYGGGRADQIRVEGLSWAGLLFFLPLGLLTYLLLLPAVNGAAGFIWWTWLPLILYAALSLLSACQCARAERRPALLGILPLWYLLMHLAYGVGLLHGFGRAVTPFPAAPPRASAPVKLIHRKRLTTI